MHTGPFAVVLFSIAPIFASTGGSVVIDSQGNIWRTGRTTFITTTPNAFQSTAISGTCATQQLSPFVTGTPIPCNHAFVIKQDATGKTLYATYLGGSSEDGGVAITTDAQGNAYVTGYTYSSDFPVTAGAAQSKNAGPLTPAVSILGGFPYGPTQVLPGGDTWIAKFAPDGTLVYSTLLGGSGQDVPTQIGVDPTGSVYVAGNTTSTDFPASVAFGPSFVFFTRLNPRGTSLLYSATTSSSIAAFDSVASGTVYITGPSAGGPYVTKFDTTTGNTIYSLNVKPAGVGAAITVTPTGNLFVAVNSPAALLQLSPDGTRILTETDLPNAKVDSVLLDSAGNAYAFGHGTGTLPSSTTPLLAQPCSPAGGAFVVQSDAAGNTVSTYLRQGDDTGVAITAPGRMLLYRSAVTTSTVTLDLAGRPSLNFGCLDNLASGALGQGLSPGQIFTLSGFGIGPQQGVAATPDASGRYPLALAGVQILVNGQPVPLLYVQAGEIHGVAPTTLPTTATVELSYNAQTAPPLDGPTCLLNPAIFATGAQAAILNQDGTLNTPANPAPLGSVVSIWATGTGYLETPNFDGQSAPIPPPFILLQYSPQVTFDGVFGTTLFAGAAPGLVIGASQINVQLPATLPPGANLSAVPVIMTQDKVPSPPVILTVR